jgi:hypothetical protein
VFEKGALNSTTTKPSPGISWDLVIKHKPKNNNININFFIL